MALPLLAAVAIPIGTAITTAFSYIFKVQLVQWAITAAVLVIGSLVGYAIADKVLPPWLSATALHNAITGFHPSIAYFLDLLGFYDAVPYLTSALGGAWVFKKIPAWAWLGPMLRAGTH